MKKCPFCAEEIQDEAIVCKHCGRDQIEEKWRTYCAWYAKLTPPQQRTALAQLPAGKRAEAERAWKALGYGTTEEQQEAGSSSISAGEIEGAPWQRISGRAVALCLTAVACLGIIFSLSGGSSPPAEPAAVSTRPAVVSTQDVAPAISDEESRRRGLEANKDSYFQQGMELSKAGNAVAALRELEKVNEVDPDYPGLREILPDLRRKAKAESAEMKARWAAEQERLLREEAAAREQQEIENRKAYADTLRTIFLDQGFDIKVRALGRRAERLEL